MMGDAVMRGMGVWGLVAAIILVLGVAALVRYILIR